jgi:DNA (cytosine-5)-methyltransferase 1
MFTYTLEDVKRASNQKLFSVVSMFAGGGGSSTGYRLAGGDILAINEFMEKARECYRANYPNTYIMSDDIRQIDGEYILNRIGMNKGDLDILDGSPPCASFSMAGNREKDWGKEKKYSDGSQRTDDLFFEYARIIKDVQPKVFVAENVKGITQGGAKDLLGSGQLDLFGEHEDTIYHTLCEAGYRVEYEVLNAKNYGVPQSRERTIFIGVRKDIDRKITFPRLNVKRYVSVEEALRGVVNTPQDIEDATHAEGIVKGYVLQLKEGESGDKYAPSGYFGLQRVDRTQPCPTICQRQGNKGACLIHYEENRELTVPELKRLQSFPDDYILNGTYKQNCERMGRAVPPLMMKAVAEHIYKTILT